MNFKQEFLKIKRQRVCMTDIVKSSVLSTGWTAVCVSEKTSHKHVVYEFPYKEDQTVKTVGSVKFTVLHILITP